MSEKITQLSKFAIKNIVNNNTSNLPMYIQLIQLLDSKVSAKVGKISKCKCSDGYASLDIQIINLDDFIQNKIDENKPIIRVNEFKTKDNLYVITQFELLHEKSKLVGQPIDFSLYQQLNYHNPQGGSEILLFQVLQNFKLKQTKQHQIIPSQSIESQILDNIQPLETPKNQQYFNNDYNSEFNLIAQLYLGQRKFKLKGRVISKSNITQFKNGNGKLFQIEILDIEKNSIFGIFFNNQCDKFFDQIQIGKVYLFEKGLVKQNLISNNTQNQSPLQIHFEECSNITELVDDLTIESFAFDFKTIDEIELMECEQKVDILCFVIEIQKTSILKTKYNESISKKTIVVYDQSSKNIDLTFWGELAENCPFQKFDILAFRGLKISEYQGNKSLIFTNQSIFQQQISQLEKLPTFKEFIQFYNQNKNQVEVNPRDLKKIKDTSYIIQIKTEFDEATDIKFQKYYEVRGYITFISTKNNLCYESCELCNRKIIQENNKQFFCLNCKKFFDQPYYKYLFNLKIADTSGSLQCSVSHQAGLMILKLSCDKFQLLTLVERDNLIKKSLYQNYRFLIVGKFDQYNNECRASFQIVNLIQDNFLLESIQLFEKVQLQNLPKT